MRLEAAAFRHLIQHLQERTDVQNIDLMNLAGFCRNCLAKWIVSAAEQEGRTVTYEEARTLVYGMPYEKWKSLYQTDASAETLKAFQAQGSQRH
jgi:hypothetical protein